MAGTFVARIEHLQELVGTGPLEAKVNYDQPYAVVMEVGFWENYRGWGSPPEGEGFKTHGYHSGGPHFLRNGLMDTVSPGCQRLADHVLDDDPGSLIRAMADVSEMICTKASAGAPIEFGDLRESDHAQVFDDGGLVYDRPAPVGPLSDDELRHKRATRSPRHGGSGRRTYLPFGSKRKNTVSPYYGGSEAERQATIDEGTHRAFEDWEISMRHYRDRGLQFRVPSRSDPYALHRNRDYDRDEGGEGSWGEWTDADYSRELKARRFHKPLSPFEQEIIDEDFG
jgi:hypothetical protein